MQQNIISTVVKDIKIFTLIESIQQQQQQCSEKKTAKYPIKILHPTTDILENSSLENNLQRFIREARKANK